MSTATELRKQIESSLAHRIPAALSIRPAAAPELALIAKLGLAGYFLIVWSRSIWRSFPQDDPPTYRALQRADTVGMFQVESRAQMSALPRNHPTRFYDLVATIMAMRMSCS